jgi:hypothetical protein
LEFEVLLLHFEEVGEGEWEKYYDETWVGGGVPVVEIHMNLRVNIQRLMRVYLNLRKTKAKNDSFFLIEPDRLDEDTVELFSDLLVEKSI